MRELSLYLTTLQRKHGSIKLLLWANDEEDAREISNEYYGLEMNDLSLIEVVSVPTERGLVAIIN